MFSKRFSTCSNLFVMAVTLVSLSHCTSVTTTKPAQTSDERVHQLVRQFDQIAFGREYADSVDRLSRWDGPIEVVMLGVVSARWIQQVELQLDLLSRLTNRALKLTQQQVGTRQIRLVLDHRSHIDDSLPHLFPEAELPASFIDSQCKSMAFTAPDGTIVSAFIFISIDQPESEISACITEELAQSMGLFNDVEGPLVTIFDDRNSLSELTFYDRVMMSTLYDNRLDTGMKRADALPIAISIIEELMSKAESPSLHRWTTEQDKGRYFHSS